MKLWRISNHADLRGLGGLRAGGRWHSPGHPVVYLAEHPAAAMLEVLVHLEIARPDDLPKSYRLLEIEVPDAGVRVQTINAAVLTANWREDESLTRAAGSAWLKSGESALLRVPSAIMPGAFNFLLNPGHADAGRLKVVAVARYPFDRRLFKIVTAAHGGKKQKS